MAAQADPARQQLEEYYISSIEQGRQPSLKWLADNSPDIVGQSVSYDTVKFWAREGHWLNMLESSLENAPFVRDTKEILDASKEILMAGSDDPEHEPDWKGFAGHAKAVLSLAKSVPDAFFLLIEADVADCYERINELVLRFKVSIPSTHYSTLVSVRSQLYKMMPQDVQVQSGGVSPDAVLLKERER